VDMPMPADYRWSLLPDWHRLESRRDFVPRSSLQRNSGTPKRLRLMCWHENGEDSSKSLSGWRHIFPQFFNFQFLSPSNNDTQSPISDFDISPAIGRILSASMPSNTRKQPAKDIISVSMPSCEHIQPLTRGKSDGVFAWAEKEVSSRVGGRGNFHSNRPDNPIARINVYGSRPGPSPSPKTQAWLSGLGRMMSRIIPFNS